MTTEQAYVRFLMKIDNNFENSIVSGDRGRFVIIFNEAQNKMLENILDRKKDDEIRYIQKMLVSNHSIKKDKSVEYADTFKLPENYFDFSSAYSKASTKTCKDAKINLYEIKDDNKVEILQDEFNKPSFLAREAPLTISSDKIYIYNDGFTHDNLFLSYYRYPAQIKLLVEDDPESPFDTDVNPEFDDKFMDRVISMAASEFEINASDPKYQVNIQRAIQKI